MAGTDSRGFTFATLHEGIPADPDAADGGATGPSGAALPGESKAGDPVIATRYEFGAEDATRHELRHSDPLTDRSAPASAPPGSSASPPSASRAAARARVLAAIGEEPEPSAPPLPEPKHVVRPAALSKLHIATMKQIFTHLDTDADGLLSGPQIRVAVASIGVPPTKDLVDDIVARADAGPGLADFDAFAAGVQEHVRDDTIDLNAVEELFSLFGDPDGPDGGVSPHMVRYVLSGIETSHKTQLHDSEVSDIFDALGLLDSDSSVDPAALIQALSSGFVGFSRPAPPP